MFDFCIVWIWIYISLFDAPRSGCVARNDVVPRNFECIRYQKCKKCDLSRILWWFEKSYPKPHHTANCLVFCDWQNDYGFDQHHNFHPWLPSHFNRLRMTARPAQLAYIVSNQLGFVNGKTGMVLNTLNKRWWYQKSLDIDWFRIFDASRQLTGIQSISNIWCKPPNHHNRVLMAETDRSKQQISLKSLISIEISLKSLISIEIQVVKTMRFSRKMQNQLEKHHTTYQTGGCFDNIISKIQQIDWFL